MAFWYGSIIFFFFLFSNDSDELFDHVGRSGLEVTASFVDTRYSFDS